MFGQTKNVGNITRQHPKSGFGHLLNIFTPLCRISTRRWQTGTRQNVSVHVTLLLGCLERLESDGGSVVFQNLRANPVTRHNNRPRCVWRCCCCFFNESKRPLIDLAAAWSQLCESGSGTEASPCGEKKKRRSRKQWSEFLAVSHQTGRL